MLTPSSITSVSGIRLTSFGIEELGEDIGIVPLVHHVLDQEKLLLTPTKLVGCWRFFFFLDDVHLRLVNFSFILLGILFFLLLDRLFNGFFKGVVDRFSGW
jgi:hypothetical protein